jgi:hypothetical protein
LFSSVETLYNKHMTDSDFNQHKILDHLMMDVIPDFNETQDAKGALLKAANTHNLPEAALERLVQLWNAGYTLNHFEKSSNRAETIDIVDTQAVLDAYKAPRAVKAASSPVNFLEVGRVPRGLFTYTPDTTKAASSEEIPADPEFWKRAVAYKESQEAKALAKQVEEFKVAIELAKESSVNVWAAHLTRTLDEEGTFQKNASDMFSRYGESVKPAIEFLAATLPGIVRQTRQDYSVEKAASNAGTHLVRNSELTEAIEELSEALSMSEELTKVAATHIDPGPHAYGTATPEDFPGFSAILGGFGGSKAPSNVGESPMHPRRGDPYEKQPPEGMEPYPEPEDSKEESKDKKPEYSTGGNALERLSNKDDKVEPALKRLEHDLTSALSIASGGGERVDSLLNSIVGKDIRLNEGQRRIDNALIQARQQAILTELMLTDEVVAEAEPETVERHYNTILKIVPNATTDPVLLGNLLRYSLANDGIDMASTKTLAEAEDKLNRNEDAKKIRDKRDYGIGGGAASPQER